MDDREKLVDMIFDSLCRHIDKSCKLAENIADDLISNGVTVRGWISATEPPKEYRDEYGELIPFLVCAEGTDYPFRAMYDGNTWGDGIFAVHVKWWMYLPSPPKEKERKDGDGNV